MSTEVDTEDETDGIETDLQTQLEAEHSQEEVLEDTDTTEAKNDLHGGSVPTDYC